MFILPWVALASLSTIVGLIGLGKAATVVVTVDQYQRRKGYKPGEGVFTPRFDGFDGVLIEDDADSTLGSTIATFAKIFPHLFEEYANKRYILTQSEGQLLKSIVAIPAKTHSGFLNSGIVELKEENPEDGELQEIIENHTKVLLSMMEPIIVFLRQFPIARVTS